MRINRRVWREPFNFDYSSQKDKETDKEMKKKYGIRSDIVHRADYGKLREKHITRAQGIFRVIVLALAENASKFEDFSKFLEHIAELRSKTS
jgi:hypothetical protein